MFRHWAVNRDIHNGWFLFLKVIRRLLPHATSDLHIALEILENNDQAHETWPTRYFALVWLSIVVLVPFELGTVVEDVVPKLIKSAKQYLGDCGVTSNAAAMLLSRLLSRPGLVNSSLPEYIGWCTENLHNSEASIFLVWTMIKLC